MVDWDRVADLRSKGWDWSRIADDPKVGFHADTSAGDPGRALRALYHRNKARASRQGPAPAASKRVNPEAAGRWTIIRAFYLIVPVVGIWAALAYAAPSPIGILVPFFPYLALVLAAVVFVLIYGLWRSQAQKWSPVLRTTVVGGVILGLIFGGMVGLVGALAFGCPYLPPSAALHSEPAGWLTGPLPTWQDSGKPVVYFYGATWCPYCSASSWAIWAALLNFGSVSGNYTSMSSLTDVDPGTPEMVLASVSFTSTTTAFQVSEYHGGTSGTPPATSSCYQQAYVTAYSGGSIPFLVVGGQYVHAGSSLIDPGTLSTWAKNQSGGAGFVAHSVLSETGAPWAAVYDQTCWVMAYMAKAVISATGVPMSTLASENSWRGPVYGLTYQYYNDTL